MATKNDEIVRQCMQEYLAGIKYKHGRVKDWNETEDQYFGRVKKTLKGRFNVPIPIMSGFVDTLHAKVDDPPALKFEGAEEADYRTAQKVQAAYENESVSEDNDWESVDLDGKKQAIIYGRTIQKAFAESDPEYKFHFRLADVYDFNCDPMGGGDLENHRFVSEDCIFKSRFELLEGAKSGLYDKEAVFQILTGTPQKQIVDNENFLMQKGNRFAALGLDNKTYNFAGQELYKFVEAGTVWKGKRYYVLYNYEMQKAIRCEVLIEVFESNLWWFTSWAPYRDSFNFWSKAPADDIRPIGEIIKVLANQELDNRNKKNYGQRAFDPDMFPNPAELEWRPDGLVNVKAGSTAVRPIQSGIYQFETPELRGTIELVNWLDDMLGRKSGITGDTQGSSSEEKVGIYYGNLQQVADRIGLQNRWYRKAWAAIGRRYVWGLFEHLTSPMAVKLIGNQGVVWEDLKKSEVNPELNIKVVGGNAQIQADEIKKQRIQEALASISADPTEAAAVAPQWRVEQKLRNAGLEEEEIRVAMDIQNYGNKEELAEAAEAIQEIIKGSTPKKKRKATTAFIQKIMDFAYDHDELDEQTFVALVSYAEAHLDVAAENMARKALTVAPNATLEPAAIGAPAVMPAPNTPQGTASRSQLTPTP